MGDTVLKAEGLQKRFPSPHRPIDVLSSAEIQLRAGESLSIRGESGAGKSTLLSILAALEQVDGGRLYWNGVDVFEKSARWQARQRATFLGMVFQAYYLIPELNAYENVLMAARMAGRIGKAQRERATALLERVGLKERMRHVSSQLSGGERQRISIARAMMNAPQLILADEPTGNLDEKTGESVMDILLSLCAEEKMSMILVTHNPIFAAQTDRCLFLKLGKLETE